MKNKNYVNLTVNPCKMCMPMGAVTAFYGIQGCMSIIHGSQGCSTYIRRHMATHYNEPVDIASSSLTEHGTVYGGEENLIAGLKNLRRLYEPQVIGIATTCLAETIGEDIPRILAKLRDDEDLRGVTLIPVASPGYGGTQYEGWFAATRAAVDTLAANDGPNGAINLVTAPMSPAEHRELKRLAACFGLDVILLPDISENLDRVYDPVYARLPQGGTSTADIRRMGGAAFTVELGLFSGQHSVAALLNDKFGVPFKRLPLPVGLRGTDSLLALFSELSGRPIPDELKRDRGRYLDAMVDAHKYCGEGRAAVFGEPDLIYGVSRLCLECGVLPQVVACGGKCDGLDGLLRDEINKLATRNLIEQTEILAESDFEKIGELVEKYRLNLMIGSSDGRRIEEKSGVSLVRVGFPIHDRVGGQRQMLIGYEGSLRLMDDLANSLLHQKESTFREESYRNYFREDSAAAAAPIPAVLSADETAKKSESHPCFNCGASGNARIHLPVAPACNIRCNYCSRRFDCVNESRPGVTSEVLTPEQAVRKYLEVKAKLPKLTVVGIAGPGDALADFEKTRATLAGILAADPGVTFCLSTNGLLLPRYAKELIKLGVTHVTVTVNAADDETAARVYAHVDYDGKRYTGLEAASLLRRNQLEGIRLIASLGAVVKANIVLLRGINESSVEQIVQAVKECGASITNIMQLIPVEGTPFEKMELVSHKEIAAVRQKCKDILPQMLHCRQCRADAVGTLQEDLSVQFRGSGLKAADTAGKTGTTESEGQMEPRSSRRYAVSSKSGVIIDEHFGHTREFLIYECSGGEVRYLEKRRVGQYCEGIGGCGDDKPAAIEEIIRAVEDCDAVLCMRIGTEPEKKLRQGGKHVFMLYDRIESGIRQAEKLLEQELHPAIYIRRSL